VAPATPTPVVEEIKKPEPVPAAKPAPKEEVKKPAAPELVPQEK